MTKFFHNIRQRHQNRGERNEEAGLTTVEYIIILCLIAIFAFGAWRRFGSTVNDKVKNSADTVEELEPSSTEN